MKTFTLICHVCGKQSQVSEEVYNKLSSEAGFGGDWTMSVENNKYHWDECDYFVEQ
jgi:hypothetical protein